MSARNRYFFLAIFLAVAYSFYAGTFEAKPVKSPIDSNAYRYLELENGLRVMLVSKPDADRAAASLDVNVGSLQDPVSRPGLAHFLEHMLFLGTKTYPEAGDYQNFINQYGGSHNAFTAQEHTNYFFDINPVELESALDRFSRFFHEPLFTESYVQREKEAVNSEYSSKKLDDYRRMQYAIKAVINPDHPASQFATGNLDTLSDNETSNIRDDLLAFYHRYYSANLMTLAVYGPQSLDELEAWVKPKFNLIPNRQSHIEDYPAPLFKQGQLPLDMNINPVKDLMQLSFLFPVPGTLASYKQKPAQYIGHLLGHEGEGSLLAWLKEKGWAESLSAGLQTQIRGQSAFQVSIGLTQDGLGKIEDISQKTFAYINLIREQGIQQWIFDELKQLDELHFRFQEGRSPVSLVQQLTMTMHVYEVEDFLKGDYLWESFDRQQIASILSKMTPDNVLRIQVAQGLPTNQSDPWFSAPYQVTPIAKETVASLKDVAAFSELAIPEPNPFVPEDVELLSDSEETKPKRIQYAEGITLWHQQDLTFKGPQSSLYITFRSPAAQSAPQDQVLMEAWVQLLNDQLNTFSYPAQLAGQGYRLYTHMRGIGLRLYGYRDKQDVVLEKVIHELKHYQPKEEQWQRVVQELNRGYQNSLLKKPYERSMSELSQYMLKPSFTEQALIEALNKLSLTDLKAYQNRFWQKLDVVLLGHGNISESQLENSAAQLQTTLLSNTEAVQVPRKSVTQLTQEKVSINVEAQHADSAMTLYFQGKGEEYAERAKMGLLGQMMHAPYYTYMRTERKYGYVVFATPYPMLDHSGMAFIIQSPTAPSKQLLDETERFLQQFELSLINMSPDDYLAHQEGLVQKLLEKPKNLREKTNRYWQEIDKGNDQFDTMKVIAEQVQATSIQTLSEYFEQQILKSPKQLYLYYDQKSAVTQQ